MSTWIERADSVFMATGGRRLKRTMVRGSGAHLWDEDGNSYLDFIGGWAVTNLGHSHPVIVEALQQQAETLIITSNDLYTVPQIELAELLVQRSCLDRAFFSNSGSEANEGAVKLARKWGKLHRNGAYEIITTDHSFHGRTLSMVSATGKPEGRVPYEPVPAGFMNVPFDDIDVIKRATTDNTVAIMLEPIQGEGGVNVPHPEYLQQVREWCHEQGLLLILDEVQTGFGRLGSLFGYETFGVEPDIMTLAKGLGGGVPISAILAKDSASVFTPGDHGTTFGGNPLVCATALASLRYIIDNDVPGNARQVGDHLVAKLKGLQAESRGLIKEVRGRGLLVGVELTQNRAMEIVTNSLNNGLMLNPANDNTLRFMPPLIITEQDVDEAVGILGSVIAELPAS